MALIIETPTPRKLLRLIREAVDDGTVSTWYVDSDGDLGLTSEPLSGAAWMRPRDGQDGRLVFNILGKNGQKMTKAVYAAYHSRLLHLCLTYFDESCRAIRVTPLPAAGDMI